MTAVVIGMVLVLVVALVVISVSGSEEKDDWSTNRPGRQDPDEGGLDDLLDG